ncbi:hypothetical protein [Nocardia sp. NBC_00403]|uniref:hypothetical protein n=1 Tax=Nocardia sp. NBC_00403 TaxID=2975990 RepID=UPI002E2478F8
MDEGRLAEIRGLLKGAEQIFYKVVLEGPGSVSEVAQKLVDQFSALVGEVRRFAEAQADGATDLSERGNTVEATGQIFMVLHREFLDAARTALDEIIDAP